MRGKGFDILLYHNDYKEITKINEMSTKYAEAWRKLGGDPTKFEGMKLIAQEKGTTSIKPKFTQENPFTFEEGMSNEDAEAAFNNLPSGSFFIDPDDGLLYEKQ